MSLETAMADILDKYDAIAERYSESDYADSERYYARRARLVVDHGPPLKVGDSMLDIACGDGAFGRHMLELGIDYRGVDASERMVQVARRTLGDRVSRATFDFEPPGSVVVTTIFRSLYLVPDRGSFLTRVRGFTERKIVFDFNPRAYSPREVRDDLMAAGWRDIRFRPFLMPQRATLPRPLQVALNRLEPAPGALVLTRVRFPILVSAAVD
jgi:SAM-dependent methyltransferase